MINLNSPIQISLLLFGGETKTVVKEPILNALGDADVYKTGVRKGEIKYKNAEKTVLIKGMGIKPLPSWKTKKDGIYSTDDATLKFLVNKLVDKESELAKSAYDVTSGMLNIRELSKLINTYYTGFQDLIYDWDSCIHGQLSHCGYENGSNVSGGTSTGRLSSTKPNLQNLPRAGESVVKNHFTSRVENGVIIEADFKQLEVVVFAFLTQDHKLRQDIKNGVDIHKRNASIIYKITEDEVTKEQRQIIKGATFAIIYGAGANRIAQDMSIDKEFAKEIVETFFKQYPQAKIWQDNQVRKVESTAVYIDELTKKGHKKQEGYLQNITGRLLYFKTNDSPQFMVDKGILTSFNPPDIKNYPVQSFATADIVLMFLGMLWRESINCRDDYLLINTVHDSVILDCQAESVQLACNNIKKVVKLIPTELKKLFNIEFNLEIDVDIKIGKSWGELK